jgi:hypothetical protein
MKPSLRSTLFAGILQIVIVIFPLLLPSAARGQDTSPTSTSNGPTSQKPLPHQVIVITNDNIKLPLVPHPPRAVTAPVPQPGASVQSGSPASAEDATAKAAEIVSLQKQIKDKQKRIELLMHLFATDEPSFLKSPSDAQDNATVQARLRSEQEELRAETAACARLQAHLDALTSRSPRP